MGARQLHTLVEGGSFFEGPRWRDGRWYVSDFYTHTVRSVHPGSGAQEVVLEVPGQPSGLGWLPDGSLLAVSMTDHRLIRRAPDGSVSEHADLTELCSGHLNDLIVDASGRAYAGNFGFEPDGTAYPEGENLWFPNAMMISGDTLIVAETFGGGFTAFTIAADGSLTDQRSWGQIAPRVAPGSVAEMLPNLGYAPDGATLDAEGHIWAADGIGGPICRIAPGGEIVDEIELPEDLAVFACQLGGEDGHTLLMCAAPDFLEVNRRDVREAVLLTTTVEVGAA
jgi:sugar lactone lactonase YvrE